LIRKARRQEGEIEYIRAKLLKAERSGFTDKTATEILASLKEEAYQNGDL
jgi:antitoxin ParD1/3/4